jgi:S-adenosylmethionine decarboxylase
VSRRGRFGAYVQHAFPQLCSESPMTDALDPKMRDPQHHELVGRHLIIDASTFSKRNLTSTENIYTLFESLARNLDMTLVIPPIVCRFPFANDELSMFTDAVQRDLAAKKKELKDSNIDVELELDAIKIMNEFLRKRKLEESGASGISLWAESHAAIHTWDSDNYFAFDAFSCKDFQPKDAVRLLLNAFDIETLNCINLLRYQRSAPKLSTFTINDHWEITLNGKKIGELDEIDLNTL